MFSTMVQRLGTIDVLVNNAGRQRDAPFEFEEMTFAHCKAHDLDNLYVVDGNFFVSIGAVNRSLTFRNFLRGLG